MPKSNLSELREQKEILTCDSGNKEHFHSVLYYDHFEKLIYLSRSDARSAT